MGHRPVPTDLELAALISSKICHDVIGPVGAIYNGLEILDEDDDEEAKSYALDVIRNVTEQASARLQFARFGGACPLWNVHQAFETPGRFLRQLAETPDGVRYLCLARDVSKPGGSFRAPVQRYAIGLGCEIAHAGALVYADDLDIRNDSAYQPIGVSCRTCPRTDCAERAMPSLFQKLHIDENVRGPSTYVQA